MPPPNTPQPANPNSHYFNTILSPNTHTSHTTPAAAAATAANTSAHGTPTSHNTSRGQADQRQEFTAQQRLAQARGKRWDNIGGAGSGVNARGSGSIGRSGAAGAAGAGVVEGITTGKKKEEKEDFETRQSRDRAAAVLESMEMLMWYSAARNESIPQTRRHFQNIVYGVIPSERDVMWREEWEVDGGRNEDGRSPRSASGKGKERERERGKKRVSSGGGA